MSALELSHQIDGAAFEDLLSVLVEVFLVALDSGKILAA